ncbi:MAG: DUF1223 domain-containing protein [Bryobacteraceae bacterium]
MKNCASRITAAVFLLSSPLLAAATRSPVLLELFTSEGCSSCPPADTLLDNLDRTQPFPNADLIVLSEHVDYWDQLGWRDPYSSPSFTAKQQQYAARLDSTEVYTPQLIIDGTWQALGSDKGQITKAVDKASAEPKLPVEFSGSRNGDKGQLRLAISPAPGTPKADIYIVLAKNHVTSHVEHGENANRTLSFTAVAYRTLKAGTLKSGSPFEKQFSIDLPAASGETRVIAYVQDPKTGKVIGLAQTIL